MIKVIIKCDYCGKESITTLHAGDIIPKFDILGRGHSCTNCIDKAEAYLINEKL